MQRTVDATSACYEALDETETGSWLTDAVCGASAQVLWLRQNRTINADPSRYRNRTVRAEGTVTNAFGALSAGGYQLEDDTGRIVVKALPTVI